MFIIELKEIKGFRGYFIRNDGTVWSNLGKGNRCNGKTVELYQVKGRPTKNGYLRVYLRHNETNKRVDKYIHRLVAEYFVENLYNKNIVNHKDSNRQNNHFTNLEWCTQRENLEHAFKFGFMERDIATGRMKRKCA